MKSIILFTFIIMAFILQSCQKDIVRSDFSDTHIINSGADLRSTLSEITTFSEFQAAVNGYGTITQAPDNYSLNMEGVWNYTTAYIYEPYNSNDVHEIYVFTGNPAAYANAQNDCDMIYTDHGNGKISCKNKGNSCKLDCVESGCSIETCLPA